MKCFRNELFTEEYTAEDNTPVFFFSIKNITVSVPKILPTI